MRVLVAGASRHGATAEIAEVIAGTLSEQDTVADVVDIDDVTGLGDYDAVVLGGAVYMGHWLKPAAAFEASHGAELRARPTWVFSSGLVGDPPRPGESESVHGDHRDWDEIRAWAEAISKSLHVVDNPGREPSISTGTRPIGRQQAPS